MIRCKYIAEDTVPSQKIQAKQYPISKTDLIDTPINLFSKLTTTKNDNCDSD